jgi:hypothetical protein
MNLSGRTHLRNPDNNRQRFTSHDIRSIDDIPDRRIASIELNQDVRRVGSDHAEDNDGEEAWNHP